MNVKRWVELFSQKGYPLHVKTVHAKTLWGVAQGTSDEDVARIAELNAVAEPHGIQIFATRKGIAIEVVIHNYLDAAGSDPYHHSTSVKNRSAKRHVHHLAYIGGRDPGVCSVTFSPTTLYLNVWQRKKDKVQTVQMRSICSKFHSSTIEEVSGFFKFTLQLTDEMPIELIFITANEAKYINQKILRMIERNNG